MADNGRRRILVALEPLVLEGAFATLLTAGERTDVVQFHLATSEELSGHYDAGIVTAGLAEELHPDVVITLPDTEAGQGVARVSVRGVSHAVTVRTHEQVVKLLAEQFPHEMSFHRSFIEG